MKPANCFRLHSSWPVLQESTSGYYFVNVAGLDIPTFPALS